MFLYIFTSNVDDGGAFGVQISELDPQVQFRESSLWVGKNQVIQKAHVEQRRVSRAEHVPRLLVCTEPQFLLKPWRSYFQCRIFVTLAMTNACSTDPTINQEPTWERTYSTHLESSRLYPNVCKTNYFTWSQNNLTNICTNESFRWIWQL